ncbi:hypothetical protein D1641_18265 [Colidextribacter sp. OB.20]|uniref:hypothetical protein n=1 Tax=Colidextribacter sp. OB.20 TaxID=2304568 RepID=UPI00136B28AD|nr:hypothetical protein [Colidextribacter sp. OB.20]NBI11913.1 hypothetical protein [Colidextribacter sp. OB.20]
MDQVIYHRVGMILAEMGLKSPISLIKDFDPDVSIKNYGPFRLYEFHLEIRDDVDPHEFETTFRAAMEAHNSNSSIKANFYDATDYPGPDKNWTTVYLTVAAL